MRTNIIKAATFAAIFTVATPTVNAFDLKDLLSKAGEAVENGTVTDMIEGVFSTSDLQVSDLAGVWTSTGSAVSFQSEDFLSKAGGTAAASTIENKINPYFKKYGLTGAIFTIQTDGAFTLQLKKTTLKGTITKSSDSNFVITFQAFGKSNLGNITTYIQKTSSSMDIMFDASKLQSLMTSIASITKMSVAQTVSQMLNSYDGICIGFKLSKTGTVEGESTSTSTSIKDLFNKAGSSNSTETQTETNSTKSTTNSIINLFKKK